MLPAEKTLEGWFGSRGSCGRKLSVTAVSNAGKLREGGKAHERIEALGSLIGRKRETPREEKAQEGCGLLASLNHSLQIRMLTGSKALKQGGPAEARFR